MDIFDNMAQAVRFAFCLEAYREAGGALVLVQMALRDAGVKLALDAQPEQLAALRTQAHAISLALHADLLRVESAALTAAFSRNWDERRAAVQVLAPYYRNLLARLVDNPKLVDKLVARHYIAQRDRGTGWDLDSLSHEFKLPKSRLTRATHALDHVARQLEALALHSLREALGLPEAKNAALQAQEVAHA